MFIVFVQTNHFKFSMIYCHVYLFYNNAEPDSFNLLSSLHCIKNSSLAQQAQAAETTEGGDDDGDDEGEDT